MDSAYQGTSLRYNMERHIHLLQGRNPNNFFLLLATFKDNMLSILRISGRLAVVGFNFIDVFVVFKQKTPQVGLFIQASSSSHLVDV